MVNDMFVVKSEHDPHLGALLSLRICCRMLSVGPLSLRMPSVGPSSLRFDSQIFARVHETVMDQFSHL